MSNLSESAARIQGLIEGSKIEKGEQKDAIIKALADTVYQLAKELEELRADHEDLNNYVESIDTDLDALEESYYGEDDDDDDDDDDDEDDDDDDRTVQYFCPHCGQEMTFKVDEFDFDDEYLCPNCHQSLFPETPDDAPKDKE